MEAALSTRSIRTGLLDLLVLAVVYVLPSASHLLGIPFYLLDPMRLLLFFTVLTTGRGNVLLIAVSLPFISTLFSGHPVFPKNALISMELFANAALFYWIVQRGGERWLAGAVSVLASKVGYYAFKYLFLRLGLLSGSLVATAWYFQLIPLVLIGGGLYLSDFRRGSEEL